ncbi:prolyl endopeptidase-like [Glossina fuscipes]|uniref:Prolyl endopeptidase-like n=1 Tax=Glossina fuscipes TaxID=7396 RepID=A0A9C5ZQA5_9MUSC|nr:prolyl endopeptidase-like [Glossina fuscipes]
MKDVYRWLEDPDSAETQQFVNEENKISQPFLDCDERKSIYEKLLKLWNYEKYGCPMKHGNYYYFNKNSGLQNQSQPEVSDCGKYLIIPIVKDCRDNILYYSELDTTSTMPSKQKMHKIIEKLEADYDYITNIGSKVYLRTNKNAPNYRVIVIDFENHSESNWITLIPKNQKFLRACLRSLIVSRINMLNTPKEESSF